MPPLDTADLTDLEALANVGEIVGPVTHEFNNLLNTLLLQIAVLEQTAPNGLRTELAGLKQYGKTAAALIRQVQQYRRQISSEPHASDLNDAVTAAVAAVRAGPLPSGMAISFAPSRDLPSVRGSAADLKRLATFLLANGVLTGGGSVAVRTEPRDGGAALVVEVAGPAVDPAFLARLTSPALSAAAGTAGLELAACRSLARRLGGDLTAAANDDDGGVRVVVELPRG